MSFRERFLEGEVEPADRWTRGEVALLAGVVCLGVVVRFLGLRLGLPYHHHWDEILVTESAKGMLERRDDVPSNYFYGAPMMRLTALGYLAAKALHLPEAYTAPFADQVSLRWVGRSIAAALSSSGIVAVYLAGRFAGGSGGRATALFAALSYAVAAELVWHARYLVTDASVVALTAWTLAFSALYASRRTLVWALVAVVFAGLTFSFKLTGLATLLLPAGVLILRSPRGLLREGGDARLLAIAHRALLVATVPLILLIFIRLNPHVREQWHAAFTQFEGIARHYRQGHVKPFAERDAGLPHLASALYFIVAQSFHTHALAALAWSSVALCGVALALRRGNLVVTLALVHALGVVFAMAWPNRAYLTRMYLPALPVLCLGFGVAIAAGLAHLDRPKAKLCGLLVAATMSMTTVVQAVLTQRDSKDTRVRAMDAVAARARARGGEVTVAWSPAVAGGLALGGHWAIPRYLARPGVRVLPELPSQQAAEASGADYVISASYRDLGKIWPYEEQWTFREVPGYVIAATFASNPLEERYDLQPTWDGHVSAIVLERATIR